MNKLFLIILLFIAGGLWANQRTTELYVTVAGKTKGEINKNDLLTLNELKLINNNDSVYHIIFFRLGITGAGYEYIDHTSDSEKLTDKMKQALKYVRPTGTKIWFTEIKCTGINKDTIELPPLNLITKEPK